MDSHARLHAELTSFLRQHCPIADERHLVLLGWTVAGLLLSQTVCFGHWQRRCRRWRSNGRAVLKKLLGELNLEGVLIQAAALHRQIGSQFQGKRTIPFVATDHEVQHGRDITWTLRARQAPEPICEAWSGTSWIVEVTAIGSGGENQFQAHHVFLTSLRTSPDALLRLVRDRWSIEGWHWIRDTQVHEDAHRHRGNGAAVMATLQAAALNLLRLAGFQSIRSGMQAVMHDITTLLAMARRQPQPGTA